MLSRLTALILTLCIGLPMCWCCITAPQPEEAASCCAKKQHSASEHSQEPNCPCAKHENARDVAVTFVNAPAPASKLLAEPVWHPLFPLSLTSKALATHAPRHDHGPPLHAPPLYTLHCALLI
jgi:hypothetical protein